MEHRVLITSRSFGREGSEPIDILAGAGVAYTYYDGSYEEDRLTAMIGDYDALVIGGHPLSKRTVEAARRLRIVCKHGTGLDNLDLDLLKRAGVAVTNAPGTNSNAVADLAFGLMLDAARRITASADRVRSGAWKTLTGRDVYKKTLGLVGFGAIARNVALRARGFSMPVLAYDPFLQAMPEEYAFVRLCGLDEVLASSDFLSLHVPLTPETKGMIGAAEMRRMKRDAILINTSRGGIVDEDALFQSLQNGRLAGAGLDVTACEPPVGSPLLGDDRVVITSHIGMYSKEAVNAVSTICARNIVNYFSGNALLYRVV